MSGVWTWMLVHFGIRDLSGPWYGFWSGFGSDLGEITLIGAIVAMGRHKNCFVKGCWRLGHPDPEHGHPACRKHHSRAKALDAAQSQASREA
jgi:hypothetical protein